MSKMRKLNVEETRCFKTADGKMFEDKMLATNWAVKLEFEALLKELLEDIGFLDSGSIDVDVIVEGVKNGTSEWAKAREFIKKVGDLAKEHAL